ncbi:GntR family transcriptional regulator [Salinifilum aidingensis]
MARGVNSSVERTGRGRSTGRGAARRTRRNRSSQAERAYGTLRERILTLDLAPGSPLQEDELTSELDIGRTPLREAVKRLQLDSLVAIYPRRGTFVTEVNITDHALIADVRLQLEGHAARRAAERATEAERSELDDLRKLPGPSPEAAPPGSGAARGTGGSAGSGGPAGTGGPSVMDVDARVHRAIYRCAHNHYLESTLGHYYNLALRIWYLFSDRLPAMDDHVAEHGELLEAVVAGDADRADRTAVAHVDHFEQRIRNVL